MTVSTTTRKQQFTLNGTTATLTFTFRALVNVPTDIKVTVTAADVDTELTYTTDYTVAVNANGIGGVVTLVDPAAVGSGTATVYRDTTNTQISDYDDYNQFPADTVENDFDIRTMIAQEQGETNDRALLLPITVSGVSATLPVPVADKVLGWNGAADAIENKTFVSSDAFEKANASDAVAQTNDTKYMTPTMTSIAIGENFPVLEANVTFNNATGHSHNGSNSRTISTIYFPGQTIQVVKTQTGEVATGTTAIPQNDTIPQIGEGDEYMTVAITPTSSTNKLEIAVVVHITNSNAAQWLVAALFKDAVGDALAVAFIIAQNAGTLGNIKFTHSMTAGTTSSITFRVRCGGQTGATTTFNGAATARYYGGKIASSIIVKEIKV